MSALVGHVDRKKSGLKGHDVWIACESCGGIWLGQPFDTCDWCAELATRLKRDELARLMFPEFINWDERFASLSPIDQAVWAATRGFGEGYERDWLRRVRLAATDQVLTGQQVTQALSRYRKWKTQMTPFSGK